MRHHHRPGLPEDGEPSRDTLVEVRARRATVFANSLARRGESESDLNDKDRKEEGLVDRKRHRDVLHDKGSTPQGDRVHRGRWRRVEGRRPGPHRSKAPPKDCALLPVLASPGLKVLRQLLNRSARRMRSLDGAVGRSRMALRHSAVLQGVAASLVCSSPFGPHAIHVDEARTLICRENRATQP